MWSAGRGEVAGEQPTSETQYRIGSITKGFAAVLVMRLRDEGLVDLDDRLERHVSGTELGDRTLRALLSHSAGIAAEPPGPWWERSPGTQWPDLAAALSRDRLLEPAGGRFHYSNVGFALLGQVVERHRQMSWYDALRAEVLDPLEMRRTSYSAEPPHADGFAVHPWADLVLPEAVQDTGAMAPAGQLWSTVADLGRWASFVTGDTGGVLESSTVEEMRAVRVVEEGPEWESAYGLGFQVFHIGGREYVGHGGSVPGFLSRLVADIGRRTGAMQVANVTSGYPLDAQELLEILERHEPTIPPPWHAAASVPAGVVEMLGLWYWGANPHTLRLQSDGTLKLETTGARARFATFRLTDSGWVGLDEYFDGEALVPVRRPDGSMSHLDIGTFVFTREPYGPDAPVPGGVDPDGWRTK